MLVLIYKNNLDHLLINLNLGVYSKICLTRSFSFDNNIVNENLKN